jgi:hypothetical protein
MHAAAVAYNRFSSRFAARKISSMQRIPVLRARSEKIEFTGRADCRH